MIQGLNVIAVNQDHKEWKGRVNRLFLWLITVGHSFYHGSLWKFSSLPTEMASTVTIFSLRNRVPLDDSHYIRDL